MQRVLILAHTRATIVWKNGVQIRIRRWSKDNESAATNLTLTQTEHVFMLT